MTWSHYPETRFQSNIRLEMDGPTPVIQVGERLTLEVIEIKGRKIFSAKFVDWDDMILSYLRLNDLPDATHNFENTRSVRIFQPRDRSIPIYAGESWVAKVVDWRIPFDETTKDNRHKVYICVDLIEPDYALEQRFEQGKLFLVLRTDGRDVQRREIPIRKEQMRVRYVDGDEDFIVVLRVYVREDGTPIAKIDNPGERAEYPVQQFLAQEREAYGKLWSTSISEGILNNIPMVSKDRALTLLSLPISLG